MARPHETYPRRRPITPVTRRYQSQSQNKDGCFCSFTDSGTPALQIGTQRALLSGRKRYSLYLLPQANSFTRSSNTISFFLDTRQVESNPKKIKRLFISNLVSPLTNNRKKSSTLTMTPHPLSLNHSSSPF